MNKRKYINELKKYEPIYVIGHSNIDIDSAISSKLLSEILSFFGYWIAITFLMNITNLC